jgi:putative hemin transport protein
MTATDLRNKWNEVKQQQPNLHDRELAAEIGVSEAELVAAQLGVSAVRLQGPWENLLLEFHRVGRVMTLTRNEAFVQERYGVFPKPDPAGEKPSFSGGPKNHISFNHGVGLVLGAIDLRLFMSHWHFGFACEQQRGEKLVRSFRFFNQDGSSVFKVYLQPESDVAAFEKLRAQFKYANQEETLPVKALPVPQAELPDSEIDKDGFLAAWQELKDTHSFHPMLGKFKVGRLQALRLAEGRFTQRFEKNSPGRAIQLANDSEQEIMLFLSNPGCIQIYAGPIQNIKVVENWFNVMDKEFHMHLREDLIAEAWLVRKPTTYGEITSIEFYDANGENIGLIFAKRHEPKVSPPKWDRILEQLGATACAA